MRDESQVDGVETQAPRDGILRSRVALLAAALFCTYEALPRSITTLRAMSGSPHEPDLFTIVFMMWAAVITILLAVRSPWVGDRAVFGVAAVTGFLRLAVLLFSPTPPIAAAVNWLVKLLWTIGAVTSFLLMVVHPGWRGGRLPGQR
jgi:hypothetical protein